MTVQVLDSITLWNGSHGVLLTPLGFAADVVQDNDQPERVRLVQEDSTALQHGYIAHWEIRGRALWLQAVHGRLCLTGGIDTVIRGKKFITSTVAEKLAEAVNVESSKALHDNLSDREFDVFKLLASGKTVSQIAVQLSLSSTTVSTYRSRIMEKMQMKSNAELARYAIEAKLI